MTFGGSGTMSAMEPTGFPPENLIRAFVEEELPEGVHIKRISTSFEPLVAGMAPNFTMVIELTETDEARLRGSPGLAYAIAKRARAHWKRDDLYLRFITTSQDVDDVQPTGQGVHEPLQDSD